jgi:hypothetical protein
MDHRIFASLPFLEDGFEAVLSRKPRAVPAVQAGFLIDAKADICCPCDHHIADIRPWATAL